MHCFLTLLKKFEFNSSPSILGPNFTGVLILNPKSQHKRMKALEAQYKMLEAGLYAYDVYMNRKKSYQHAQNCL